MIMCIGYSGDSIALQIRTISMYKYCGKILIIPETTHLFNLNNLFK